MKLKAVLGLVLLAGLSTGCQTFQYSYEENGCSTGTHEFNSQEDMCNGLQNEDMNNNCAYSSRSQKYQDACSNIGSTQKTSYGKNVR